MTSEVYDIFISHNSRDKEVIVPILERLNDEYDIRTWLDKWDLFAASDWASAIEEALQSCASCAVFLGSHGWGQHHLAEARQALSRKERHPNFKVIPILLPGAGEDDINVLADLFTRQHRVDFTNGLDDEEAFRRLLAAIRGDAPGPPPVTVFSIKRDAVHWRQLPNKDKSSILYRGAELREAQSIARLHSEKLSDLVRNFLLESEAEELRQLARERARNRRIIFGLTAGIISISVAFVYAVAKRDEAEAQRDKAAQRLVAQRVANGTRAATDGDLWGAWSWYADALQLARRSDLDERAHRERLGGLRRQLPHLRQLWHTADKAPAAAGSSDGDYVALCQDVFTRGWTIEILRAKDGARVASIQSGPSYLREMVFSPDGDELWTLESGFDPASQERRVTAAVYGVPGGALKSSRGIKEEHSRARWLDARTLALIDYRAAHLLRFRDGAVEVDTITGPPDAYVSAVSHDGSLLAAYSNESNKLLLRRRGDPGVNAAAFDFAHSPTVAFSPDGKHLITMLDRKLAVWRLSGAARKVAEAELGGSVVEHQFDRTGRLLLTEGRGGGTHASTLWRFEQATLLKSFDHEKILARWEFPADARGGGIGAGAAVGAELVNPFKRLAVLSGDGQRILTVSENTRSYRVWDMETGEALTPPMSHGASKLLSVWLSKHGRALVSSAGDGTTKLWDVALPRRSRPLIGQSGTVTSLRFVGGGDRLLSISGGRASLLDWASGRELTVIGERLDEAEPAAGGRMIAGRQSDRFRLWRAETLAPASDWLSHPSVDGAAVSEKGLYAASWDKGYDTPLRVRVWNLREGKLVGELTPGNNWLTTACIDEREKVAMFVVSASEGRGRDLIVYDLDTGETSRPRGFQNFSFEGLFFSEREGSWMGFDGRRFWRLAQLDQHRTSPYSTSSSSLTKFLTASADGTRAVLINQERRIAQLIDVRTGAPLTPEFRHEWDITEAEINPEATRLLTVSGNKAHLWDLTTGDALVPVVRYPETVTASALHPGAGAFAVSAKKEVGDDGFAIFVESLAPETADVESLVAYGEVNGEQRVDAVGARLPLSAPELAATWSTLLSRDPSVLQEPAPEAAWLRQLEQESGRYIEQQLYYLGEILERVPDDTPARLERAYLYQLVDDHSAAIADLVYLIESGAFDNKIDLTSERIHQHCRLLLLNDRPLDAFRMLRNQNVSPQGSDGWLLALVSYGAEEFEVYRRTCESMLQESRAIAEGGGPWEERWNSAYYTAQSCILAEDTRPQFSAAVTLATEAVGDKDGSSDTLRLLQGADALKAGSLLSAEASLRGLEQYPLGKLLTADLLFRRGDSARARILQSELSGELKELMGSSHEWLEVIGLNYLNQTMGVKLGTR